MKPSSQCRTVDKMCDQTPAEEICELVAVYYADRGESIPAKEWAYCKAELKAERDRKGLPESWVFLKEYMATPLKETKPEFGTPEFWAYMRKQKKERLAAEAAKEAAKTKA